jgi:hypothetical protein
MRAILAKMSLSDEEIYEWCAAMYLAVDESYDQVYLVHSYLVRDEALYLAVWERLEAPFRRFWKSCLEDWKKMNTENGT